MLVVQALEFLLLIDINISDSGCQVLTICPVRQSIFFLSPIIFYKVDFNNKSVLIVVPYDGKAFQY